jgi:hypothetical protein
VQVETPRRSAPGTAFKAFAVTLVAAAAFVGSATATGIYHYFTAPAAKPQASTTTVLRGTSTIISAIHDLALLETASYHMERVIDLRDRQTHFLGLIESQDAVLLVAAADIIAGIDLSQLSGSDVQSDQQSHTALITLPQPTILSARLDNDHTYVHTRRTDVWAVRAEALETRARQEAERELRDAAIAAGILHRARDNAARTIKTLVQGLGYARVEVRFLGE